MKLAGQLWLMVGAGADEGGGVGVGVGVRPYLADTGMCRWTGKGFHGL